AAWDVGVTDKAQVAYIIATADHESRMGSRLTESESQAEALGYSKTYRGRGYGHLTHKDNDEKFGEKFGVDLVSKPELAADEKLAATILVDMLTESPARPVRRGGKRLWWNLKDFGVKEGATESKLAVGWLEARGMH